MRENDAPTNELGNYSFYCRACGLVMKADDMPIKCDWCGNSLIDRGFGISGDASLSETSVTTYANRGYVIVDVDKPIS